jgi:rfaE bifunctional protein kinase chain/domain
MSKPASHELEKILEGFEGRRICVLGDLMVDKYIWGDVARISPEAPVPVVEVKHDSTCLGGAGNVCRNLEELGAAPVAVGVVGEDGEGDWIAGHLSDNSGLFRDPRPTTVKTRIVAHQQQVVRVDWEKKGPLSAPLVKKILKRVEEADFEGLIISDYNKGLISEDLTGPLLPMLRKRGIPVFVDPKVKNFSLFSQVTMITPNHLEAASLLNLECETDGQVIDAGQKLISSLSPDYMIIKRGRKGMAVFQKDENPYLIPAVAKEVFDVTGAGDTVIAVASLALLAGSGIKRAAQIANVAAGVVVGKIGTASLTTEELRALVQSLH